MLNLNEGDQLRSIPDYVVSPTSGVCHPVNSVLAMALRAMAVHSRTRNKRWATTVDDPSPSQKVVSLLAEL